MDATAQAEGERNVQRYLIEPLLKRGLAKPSTLTRDTFAKMIEDLCAKLAYVSPANLLALEEQIAAHCASTGRERLPIANDILTWAAQIQPPADDASPLIRAVFAAPLGEDALNQGWAPELLRALRLKRRWPGAYAVSAIKGEAAENIRLMALCEEGLARGEDLPPERNAWRQRRRAAIEKCRAIRALGQQQQVSA